MTEHVILVDNNDEPIGTEEKLAAHMSGALHRAFSIFIFNSHGELLLQKRAASKYHSGGLWTNTCCSHPRPDEDTLDAGHRRIAEEMGFDCPLREVGNFTYRTEFSNGLIEHEFDHLLFGSYDGEPHPNPTEAAAYKWVTLEWLKKDLDENPDTYTVWLKLCFLKIIELVG